MKYETAKFFSPVFIDRQGQVHDGMFYKTWSEAERWRKLIHTPLSYDVIASTVLTIEPISFEVNHGE